MCVLVLVWSGSVGGVAEKSAIAADFMPLSPSLSLCFALLYKSPTLFTLITQIGFPGINGGKGVTGGP